MKKFILTIFVIFISFFSFAQNNYKITQKSERNMPRWVNSVEKEFLIVSSTASDIEKAKAAVLENIKQQIAESVASRVVAETELSRTDLDINGNNSYKQQLKTNIHSQTAKLPFMSEISLSKASQFYWEVRYYKSSKKSETFYAVKYPFSDFDMKKLVMEFQKHDKELNERLLNYENNLISISSIEDIDKAIVDLNAFLSEFLTADPRYKKVESIINNYRKQYDYIVIDTYQAKKGVIVATMTLNNNPITSQQKPLLKSNCASKIKYDVVGNIFTISYDDNGCYDEDENYIDIRFRTGNKYLNHRAFFKSTLAISLTGVVMDAVSREPIPYAKLTIIPSGKGATSGRNGVFQYNDLPSGSYSVQAIHNLYETSEINIQINEKKSSRCDILMNRKPADPHSVAPSIAGTSSIPVQSSSLDPLNTVRNGLTAYYRFNNNVNNELGSPTGILVNGAKFSEDSKDGTQSVILNAIDRSYINFPKGLISVPINNYSVTFWAKGISDGHIFTSGTGGSYSQDNAPMLVVTDGKFKLINRFDNEVSPFSNGTISYDWHFFAFVVDNKVQSLYMDGQLVDRLSFSFTFSTVPTKFQFGGTSYDGVASVGMWVDNLRIYNSRSLNDGEVLAIYNSEK